MILAQFLGQPLVVLAAVLVLSGFLPCACGSVGIFQAIRVPPFTVVACRISIQVRCITPLQLWAIMPITPWDLAVAVWRVEAPGPKTLALTDLRPLLNPWTHTHPQFRVAWKLSSNKVHLAIYEKAGVHSARHRTVSTTVSLDEKTALSWAVNLNSLRLIEFWCSLEYLHDS